MKPQSLDVRLTRLYESLKQTQQLITRLSKLSAQPGSIPSNPEEGDARLELGAEIHQGLKEQEEDLESLRQEVDDCIDSSRREDSGRERLKGKTNLAAQVARLDEDLKM